MGNLYLQGMQFYAQSYMHSPLTKGYILSPQNFIPG